MSSRSPIGLISATWLNMPIKDSIGEGWIAALASVITLGGAHRFSSLRSVCVSFVGKGNRLRLKVCKAMAQIDHLGQVSGPVPIWG